VELQRIGRIPDKRATTIRAVIAVLEEQGVHYRTWYAAAVTLGGLEATEAVDALVQHIDYKEGLADFPDGASATTWALYQIGEPSVGALASVLSNGGVAARKKAADALGLIQGERAEQALQRARQVEKEKSVTDSIDDALRRIERARSALRETTEPAAVARNCLSAASPGFIAKPIKTLFLDERPARVDEILCYVDALLVSDPGNWWLLKKTPSGVESNRIGRNSYWGYSIDDFVPSPDGKYLAVLSSREGAPFIQVVDLVEFVRKKNMKSVGELGPGPGASLKGWKGSTLEVSSSLFIIGYGTELLGTDAEVFSWNVRTGAVIPQWKALRDPVRYYCGFVTSPSPLTRSMAAVALRRVFRGRSSASCIEAALKQFPNDTQLKSALRHIQAQVSPPSSGGWVLIVSGAGADRRLAQSDQAGFLEEASIAVPEDITPESIEAGLKNVVWDPERLRAAVAFERKEGSFVVVFATKKDRKVIANDISRSENANLAAIGPGRVYVRRRTVPVEWQAGTGFLVVSTEAWDAAGKRYAIKDFLKFDDDTGLPFWR
jgi:hypothetical protein